jgi:hypothetical protein
MKKPRLQVASKMDRLHPCRVKSRELGQQRKQGREGRRKLRRLKKKK